MLAGGLLYVQGAGHPRLRACDRARASADLPIGDAHWQSPIVADGRVAAGEGNANDHQTSGVLDIYRLG